MKKYFICINVISGFSCISCSDDEKGMANIDREWMTMFICDNNRGKGMIMLIIVKQRDRMAMIFIFIGME